MDAKDYPRFNVEVRGLVTQRSYSGEFQVRPWLTKRLDLARDRLRREYLGGYAIEKADEQAAGLANALSQINIRVTESPQWWRDLDGGLDCADDNLVLEVYRKCMEAEAAAVQAERDRANGAVKAVDPVTRESAAK